MPTRIYFIHAIWMIFITALILSGCATATLDKDGAQKFAKLNVYEFVKQRFVKAEETPVSDSITNFLDKVTSFGATDEQKRQLQAEKVSRELQKHEIGLMADGRTVIYKAYYNGMNNRQLKRPVTEMRLYCEANRGALTIIKLDLSNKIVTNGFDTPAAAYSRVMNTNFHGYISNTQDNYFGSTTVTLPMNDYKREIAQSQAYLVTIQNKYLGMKGAIKGYDDARYRGAFGQFMCVKKANKQALWRVVIVPVYFKADDNESSTAQTHQLRILISPLAFSHAQS